MQIATIAADLPEEERLAKLYRFCSQHAMRALQHKVLSNTIETNFQILSTKYAKFQPNIQIFEYSISCLVTNINNYFDTNKPK